MDTKEIIELLEKASDAYYNSGELLMSDEEFDKLVQELKTIDPKNAFLQKVGAPVMGTPVKHETIIGSQEKLKDRKEFDDWIKKVEEVDTNTKYVCQHKLDGITVVLYYKNGKLTKAATRGDGITGEDITSNVFKFKNVKKDLKYDFTGSLRGEVLLNISDFNTYFKPLGYKNPRNTVAGMSRDQKGETDLIKHFKVHYFDVMGPEFKTETSKLSFLQDKLGLDIVNSELCNSEDLWKSYKEIETLRNKLDFEIDGIVAKVNSIVTQNEMGISSDMRPKGQRCIKFIALGAITKLLSIDLSIGHTGAIYPTAMLEPVNIGGVTITKALLNNYEEIERLGIAINDEVMVIRSGDVIPKLTECIKKAKNRIKIVAPEKCISCSSILVKDGAHIFCKNEDCDGKAARRIKTWVTKRGIKFLGEELIIELYENHNIKEPQDIYTLTEEYLSKVKRGAGVVGDGARHIMPEIEKSKNCTLSDFLGSIAIPLLGRRQVEILIENGINTLDKFLTLKESDLVNIPGFSTTGNEDSKGNKIIAGIKKARPIIDALLEAGIEIQQEEKTVVGDKLANYALCFTGVRPKSDEEAKFVSLGGTIRDSISKNVTHLVMKDPTSTSSKAEKAKQIGIKLMSYADFQELLK